MKNKKKLRKGSLVFIQIYGYHYHIIDSFYGIIIRHEKSGYQFEECKILCKNGLRTLEYDIYYDEYYIDQYYDREASIVEFKEEKKNGKKRKTDNT